MRHQLRLYEKDQKIHISGEYLEAPFGAFIDVKNKTAEWDASVVNKNPIVPARPESTKATKTCPGCVRGAIKLMKGGMGWAKELLGVGQVEEIVAVKRQNMCLSCPSNCYDFGICRDDWPDRPEKEQGCGCVLALKVTQTSEKCPHDHW